MKKFKLLRKYTFENSLQNSTPTGSKGLFSAGGVVSNDRGTEWKREVQNKSGQSELHFGFVSFRYLDWV
jgi:hypothetical protein